MTKDFWKNIPKPIVALAPMDGVTDSAFRRVCKMVNPNIVSFTEFTSADGIHHGADAVKNRFQFHPDEQPVFAQIFGKNVESFVTAAKYCEEKGFAGVDINMGCPSKKVVKSEHGVALRKKPDLAFRLIEAVANATKLPVSVKTRLGWESNEGLIEFGKGAQNSGANLITIHGRTYCEPYNCPADFNSIYELKKNISIPVIGNGGVVSIEDGMQKLGNLDGFMIGRATLGNPWVFLQKDQQPKSFFEKIPVIKKHAQFLIESKGERIGTLEIRKHLLAYIRGVPFATDYRTELTQVKSLEEIFDILNKIVLSQEVLVKSN